MPPPVCCGFCSSRVQCLGLPEAIFESNLRVSAMAKQSRPRGGEQETAPDSRRDIVILEDSEVAESNPEQGLEATPPRGSEISVEEGRELSLLEKGETDPKLRAQELGVGWDTAGRSSAGKTPMGWLVLIGVLLVVLGGWSAITLSRGEINLKGQEAESSRKKEKEARETASALALIERLERAVSGYLSASTVEEKSSYVRHRERVLPLMRDHYRRHELLGEEFESIEDLRAAEVENYPFFGVDVKVAGKTDVKLLLIEDCEDGELRFDWESEVSYQPMAISDYVGKKPTDVMEFRVYAELDSFYSYEFSDQDRYKSIKLTFRDEDEFLFGYVERGSMQERGLTAILEGKENEFPLLLRLRFLPDTRSRRSVLIEEVLATSWVLVRKR